MSDIDLNTYKYKIDARNQSGATAADFLNRYFKTQKAAISAFDGKYDRSGWTIHLMKCDPNCEYEPTLVKTIKSTYR
jgi:hypothetical protein